MEKLNPQVDAMLNIPRAILFHPLAPCQTGSRQIMREVGVARSTTMICLFCPTSTLMITATAPIQTYLQGQISTQIRNPVQIQIMHWTITIHFHRPTRGCQAIPSHPTMRLCRLFCPVAGPIITSTTRYHHHPTINLITNVQGQRQLPRLD